MKFQLFYISLLATLLFNSLSSNAATSNSVYDTDGDALIPGNQYYILPVIRGRGGGLTMSQHSYLCPFHVAQDNMEVNNGYPLVFRPANLKDKTVRLSTDINIEFVDVITTCMQSTTWQLGNVEGAAGNRYVITGGSNGNPGKETVSNWFKIEKWGTEEYYDYKLVFCPSVCETCKVVCGDVGVFNEDGKRLLGLSGEPFPVMFKKKDS